MIVCEKTRQLARRVPFQRALAARDLGLIEQPELIRYRVVEEVADDGPLYLLGKGASSPLHWDESPEPDEGRPFDRTQLKIGSTDPEAPLYENHWPSAQRVWEQLHDKRLLKEITRQEPDGRQLHVELGQAEEGVYLYCANTFDRRQLVLVEPARSDHAGILLSGDCERRTLAGAEKSASLSVHLFVLSGLLGHAIHTRKSYGGGLSNATPSLI